jgi:hypothetical protein
MMKRIFLILLLFIALLSWGSSEAFFSTAVPGANSEYNCADDVCEECVYQERFECGTQTIHPTDGTDDNNEYAPDAACSGTSYRYFANEITDVLQGNESFTWMADGNGSCRAPLGDFAITQGYAAFIWQNFGSNDPSSANSVIFRLYEDTGFYNAIDIVIADNGQLRIMECNVGVRDDEYAANLGAVNQRKVYVKIQWDDDTDVVNWWTSLTGKSGDWTSETGITVDDCTLDMDNVVYMGGGASMSDKGVIDDIRVSESDINYP